MGKRDEYQYDYLDDNVRFADQINGALFKGRQVVKPEELEPADGQIIYLGKEAGVRENFKTIIDKTRLWKGRLLHILAVENQTYVDYRMILRNMLSESLSYHRQWKKKKAVHDRNSDLQIGTDAFLSGMTKEDKFIPIITLVVYCGTEHPWDGARCLYELLELDDEVKDYVTNYRLNLYDCHEHDTFDEYRTGLRQLFETVRYGKDKEQLRRVIEENKDAYSNIDGETKELLEVVANVKIPELYQTKGEGEQDMESREKRFNVCKAWEDWRLEGKEEGKAEGKMEHLVQAVCKKLQKNKQAAVIADELEEELAEIEKVIEVQKKIGSYDVGRICEALMLMS